MAADKQSLRQQILAQLDRCHEIAYGAGHHFAQHRKHAPSSKMTQADADAKLIRLIEEYAQAHATGVTPADTPRKLVELNWPPEVSQPQPMYYVAHPDGSFSIATPQPILRRIDGVKGGGNG